MTGTAFLELLASYEAALEATKRSLAIARELAEAHQDGRPLPAATLTAYQHGLARDEQMLQELRDKVVKFKGWFRTH